MRFGPLTMDEYNTKIMQWARDLGTLIEDSPPFLLCSSLLARFINHAPHIQFKDGAFKFVLSLLKT